MTLPEINSENKALNMTTVTFGTLLLDIVQPTKETIKYLSVRYNFSPLTLRTL